MPLPSAPRRIESPRFHQIETFSPHGHADNLRVHEAADLDHEVAKWLGEAYQVGRQLHLPPRGGPRP
ncbi:MAG: hypothetical protein ACR2NX_00155 [Chthoniobacterales bacterium]